MLVFQVKVSVFLCFFRISLGPQDPNLLPPPSPAPPKLRDAGATLSRRLFPTHVEKGAALKMGCLANASS